MNKIFMFISGSASDEASLANLGLLRMYIRFVENNDIKTKIYDYVESEVGGLKSAAVLLEGNEKILDLMYETEQGIHSVTQKGFRVGRITTWSLVELLPYTDWEPDAGQLKINTHRSSGLGVTEDANKIAVRVEYIPLSTSITLSSTYPSSSKLMHMCIEILAARLTTKRDGWNGKLIRNYVSHPYKDVKNVATGNRFDYDNVMDGNLLEVMEDLNV